MVWDKIVGELGAGDVLYTPIQHKRFTIDRIEDDEIFYTISTQKQRSSYKKSFEHMAAVDYANATTETLMQHVYKGDEQNTPYIKAILIKVLV